MKLITLFSILALALTGCTTLRKVEAPQATANAPEGVRVQLGSDDRMIAGEKVQFFSYRCKVKKVGSMEPREVCSKMQMGDGEITDVLSATTSVVQPNPGVKVSSEMYVEKKSN